MDRDEISALTHGDLTLLNPLAPERLDRVVERLALPPGARVVDVGCGRGEALGRIADRWEISGTGIDVYAPYVEEARARWPAVDWVAADASTYAYGTYDLAMTIGSAHALGDGALERLGAMVPTGGQVLLGDGFWQRPPEPAYLEALGAAQDELPDYAGVGQRGADAGLTLTYATVATQDEWDAYEWQLILNGERSHDPDVRDWVARARARVLAPGGRDTLGFGLFLFRRD